MKSYSITDVGQVRTLNEDFVFASDTPVGNLPNLFVVADGMGGHNAGDFASKYAVETLLETIRVNPESNPIKIIRTAIETANSSILKEAAEHEAMSGMGTTMVLTTIVGDYAYVANVGDSRLYLINDQRMLQITKDHSLVEEMVRMGELSEEDARTHPDKNVITRALGAIKDVVVDFFDVHLEPGDRLLLCSDGLTNMVLDEDIEDIIVSEELLETAGKRLVEAANENGGKDNIGIVLVEPDTKRGGSMLDVGVIVGDRYEIVGCVGSGGMADVYKAKDHKLNRFVAVKVLKPEFGSDTTFISKFQREAQAAAGLAHPNIVNVFDVGEDNGINYIVMELVEGITLKEYISKKGRLTVKETTSIAIQVAMGLEAAHNKKIVHRDIKPQNIIISTDGKVKVTDFGIARAASSNTISTNAMGSVHYSSPEQVRGGYSDYKSDIYSLGITMYEMVTGTVPFDGDTTVSIAIKHLQEEMIPPSELNPQLPHSLEEIIMKCTQKSPDRRYNSLAELISDLKQSLIDPDGNFVNLTPLSNHAQTVVISPEEMEQIKRGAVAAGNTVPESNPEVDYEKLELPNEDEYINDNSDYDYKDDDDAEDYDADEEEHNKKGISHALEKAMTIGGIIVGAIIICVLIYTIASASGLLKSGSSKKDNTGNTTTTENKSDNSSDSSVKQVEVPDLTNKTPEEAQKTLNDLQLGYKNGGEEASDSVAEGNICRQDVEAGTKVEPYTQITCYTSSGTEEIQVPDVTDYSQTDAEAMLKELGLKTAVQKANSSEITIGNVVSTDPEAGASVKAGDTVTLTISIGEGDTAVRVPNVIGTSEADAKSTLSQLGLLVSVQTGNDQSVNEGEVYKQSVDSGTRVNTGETITIYVRSSSSSDDEDEEDNSKSDNKSDSSKTDKNKDKNSDTSSEGTWKPANSLQQPANYQGGKVKVELVQTDDDGNTYSDQSMEVDDPQFPLSIQDLEGHPGITSGTVVLYEYIDDSYQIIDQYDVSFRQVN